jgi:hypothetical protein
MVTGADLLAALSTGGEEQPVTLAMRREFPVARSIRAAARRRRRHDTRRQ